jgi:hypothetical protein
MSRRVEFTDPPLTPSPPTAMVEGPYSARFHHIDRGDIPTVQARSGGWG